MARITDYRLSFIWTETILDVLMGGSRAAAAPMPEALSRAAYVAWFDRVQRDWPAPDEPAPPWPDHGYQRFWSRYLESHAPLRAVSGQVAWRSVVPIRVPAPVAVDHADDGVRAWSEGLVHPWGVAFVLNVVCTRAWNDFDTLTKSVVECRRGKPFRMGGKPVSVEDLASGGLDALRTRVFGDIAAGRRRSDPFSIFTPVRGRGTQDELDPGNNDALHRLLQAAASFSPSWDWDALVVLDEGRVARRAQQPASHVVFGTRRGRSVWGPAYLAQGQGKRSLSCQHRNLVFASAQVESLSALAEATAAEAADRPLGGDHDFLAHRAMAMLGTLYLGRQTTHRTGSVPAQIKSVWLHDVNTLRQRLELAEL